MIQKKELGIYVGNNISYERQTDLEEKNNHTYCDNRCQIQEKMLSH